MKTSRPEPLFADRILASTPRQIHMEPRKAAIYQDKIRKAEKMVFDTEASIRIGEMLRDIPELLVEQIQFARAPFENCWIEYDSLAVWNILSPGRDIKHSPWDNSYDTTVGLLIDHNKVNVWSLPASGDFGMLGFTYYLNTEWLLEDQLDWCEKTGMSRLGIDMWLWGSLWSHFHNSGQHEYLRKLRDTTKVELDFPKGMALNPKSLEQPLQGTQGDFKNTVAILLALNQPRVTNYIQVPRRRGWIGNKNKPFMSYHSVKVALDAVAQTKLLSQGDGQSMLRRGGHVSGCYCHNKTARDYARIAGCIHDWGPCDDDWEYIGPKAALTLTVNHWQCRVCDGRRWWRKEHDRDASLGFVEHPTYRVTATPRRKEQDDDPRNT